MLDNTHQNGTAVERTAAAAKAPAPAGILRRAQVFSETVERKAAGGLNPLGVVIDEMLGPVEATVDGRYTVMFGTNSYLGLNFHPDCINVAVETIRKYGTGSTASRVAGGNQRLHLGLEQDLSDLFDGRQSIVFSTGFMANLAVISALAKDGCAVLLDSHCHASIFDAAQLSGAKILTFEHNDADSLDELFRTCPIPPERCLVVVEGLYSVWGDIGNLKPIVEVTKRHGGVIVVDEAHSFGLLGDHGRGLCEELGIEDDVDVIIGTFSKCVGVVGGFCITTNPALRGLRFLARPYLYTASLPPAVVASARESIRIIGTDRDRRSKVWANAKLLHNGLSDLGFQLCADVCPVGAIRMPNFQVGMAFWRTLLDKGVYVNILVPPGTPDGSVALRFSASAAHTPDMISGALKTFEEVGRQLGVIK
jgi:8-amino-7-oxononanoate synthase